MAMHPAASVSSSAFDAITPPNDFPIRIIGLSELFDSLFARLMSCRQNSAIAESSTSTSRLGRDLLIIGLKSNLFT